MSDWQTLSSEEVYKTPWIRVRRDEVLNQNGKPLTYSVVEMAHPSVFVVATNDKGEVLVQQNYRYTIDKTLWEIPAGHSDGEDPLTAAKRELLEESGMVSDDWVALGRLYQAVGIGNIPLEAFWAKNVYRQSAKLDNEEDIQGAQFRPLDELERMLRDGQLVSTPEIAALYLAKVHGL